MSEIKRKKSRKRSKIINNILTYTILIILSLFVLVPFYVIIVTSIKTNVEATSIPFTWWPKKGIDLTGYSNVLLHDMSGGVGNSSIIRGFKNTLLFVLPPTIIGLFVSAFAAYAFAKIKFPGNKIMFTILLLTMMLPGVIMLTPLYVIYDAIGFVNTPWPLIIPGMFGAAACVFFLRQFFIGIPDDLIEAAKIDGMNHFSIFVKIMIPLSKPALISQGILGFIAGYNDYFGPLLYLQSPDLYTLQLALKFSMGTYSNDWQTIMAGTIVSLIPTIIIYIFAQKYFIKGIATSGLK